MRLWFVFSCGDSNPLRDVFSVQRPAGMTAATTTSDLKTTDQEEKLEWMNGEVTLTYSEEAGTQIIQHQSSLTDYCSVSSDCSLEPPGSDCSGPARRGSLTCSGCVPLSEDQRGTGGDQNRRETSEPESELDSAEILNPTLLHLQALTVLLVNETLWIPRYKHWYMT